MQDYIHNGKGYGPVGEFFAGPDVRFDLGRLKPFLNKHGVPVVTIETGKMVQNTDTSNWERERKTYSIEALRHKGIYIPTGNAVTTRKGDYEYLDKTLLEISRKQQVFAAALEGIGTTAIDGMKKEVYTYEAVSDYGNVAVDMDGMSAARSDHPVVVNSTTPLYITHFDVTRSARHLGIWSNGNTSLTELDTKTAGIKIGESVEKQCLGIETTSEFGTYTTSGGWFPQRSTTGAGNAIVSKAYGATTHPARFTKTNMTVPTGLNPQVTFQELLGTIQTLRNSNFRGPFKLFYGLDWDQYMNNDYLWTNGSNWAANPSSGSLRTKITTSIPAIQSVECAEFLTSTFTMLLIPTDSRYLGMINGMGLTTVQWPSKGGMQQNWKTMTIKAPLFRFDQNGYLPVYHLTTA